MKANVAKRQALLNQKRAIKNTIATAVKCGKFEANYKTTVDNADKVKKQLIKDGYDVRTLFGLDSVTLSISWS